MVPVSRSASPPEAFRVGREAGVPIVLSHHKVTGKAFWGTTAETLRRVEAARAVQPVAIDVYPCEHLMHMHACFLRTCLLTWLLLRSDDASSTVLKMDAVERAERVIVTWSEAMPEVRRIDRCWDLGCILPRVPAMIVGAGRRPRPLRARTVLLLLLQRRGDGRVSQVHGAFSMELNPSRFPSC